MRFLGLHHRLLCGHRCAPCVWWTAECPSPQAGAWNWSEKKRHMRVLMGSLNGGTGVPQWLDGLVYNGKSYWHRWFEGTPISGNLPMLRCRFRKWNPATKHGETSWNMLKIPRASTWFNESWQIRENLQGSEAPVGIRLYLLAHTSTTLGTHSRTTIRYRLQVISAIER